ncbi:hypothetical protein F5148DRAFT_1172088 [Russula earlei]|uniref:Uncharacterized protein n=1 Tax=Russula earlei TaxID=71964 RepID=A0ACC0UIL5_9AGAM|nr:hypothetical protein F5148DRAFT_1172088 [Russula earlei]
MRTSIILAISCLAIGVAPSFAASSSHEEFKVRPSNPQNEPQMGRITLKDILRTLPKTARSLSDPRPGPKPQKKKTGKKS